MLNILREITKTVLILLYWLFPIYIVKMLENPRYLWLFIVSFLLTTLTLVHYENLAGVPDKSSDPEEYKPTVDDLYPKK